MAEVPTCDWTGRSGAVYKYWIYALPATFDAGQPGNYIYAKQNREGRWVPVYIGQGELADRATGHHQQRCIQQKGATHFHCHKTARESDRLSEEEDLLANYTNAYQPGGCNERRGG